MSYGGMESMEQPRRLNSNLENFNRTTSKIRSVLNMRQDNRRAFGERGVRLIESSFNIMLRDFQILSRNSRPNPSQEEIKTIEEMVDFLTEILVEKALAEPQRVLIIELARLAYNWNQNVFKSQTLEKRIKLLNRLVTGWKTIEDSILVLQRLIIKANRILRFTPASIEVSRAYLKSLEESMKEE